MSNNNPTLPISTAFELQRDAIRQGQEAFEQSLEFQQRMNRAMLEGMDTQEEAQRSGVEFSQQAIHAYLDTLEASVPGAAGGVNEIRQTVDEQFETLLDAHSEAFEATEQEVERGIDSYDEFSESYLEALDEQLDALLDAHQRSRPRP